MLSDPSKFAISTDSVTEDLSLELFPGKKKFKNSISVKSKNNSTITYTRREFYISGSRTLNIIRVGTRSTVSVHSAIPERPISKTLYENKFIQSDVI